MLKNHELLDRMSLHQQIRLITSAKHDENYAVENYEFPVFHLYSNPSLRSEDKFATFFPTDKALAATWDRNIVRNVYECTGNEAKANKEYAYFNITNSSVKEAISEDGYITAQFLKNKAEGVQKSGACINFDNNPATQNAVVLHETVKSITDGVLSENKVNSVRVYSVEEAEKLPAQYAFKGLVFGVAASKSDVAAYISGGATLVFVNSETADGLEDYLVELTDKFSKSKEELDGGKINLAEFDRRKREGEILDAEAVTAACDKMISLLLALKERGPQSVEERVSLAGKSQHDPLFNEVYHDKLAYFAAQQSIVLIKNNNRILPLSKDVPVAVIGEYATNNDYRITNKNNPTLLHRPFDEINNYKDINAVGYAHGYSAGETRRLDLIETALNLCDEAKCALVYLSAGRKETAIPTGQMELLDALVRKGVKIIAIVSAERSIDLSFADKCEAVLFSYNAGQGSAQAVFDIISGEISPSGKLVDTFYKDFGSVSTEEEVPDYCTAAPSNVLYPFGYGLSFTEFEYRNLKITDSAVSCTITNKGRFDGYCTLQMYVRRAGGQNTLANRMLRGFTKIFIKKGDSVKAEIPITDETFKVYDKNNDRIYVQGGKYEISLCENVNTTVLRGERDFRERTFSTTFENKVVATSENGVMGFSETELDKYIKREKKKLSFGFRLFIVIMLALYYNAMGAGLLVTNLISEKTLLLYIVIGALLFAGDVLAIVYIVIISKRRKLQKFMHPNEVLTDMVYKVKEFDEVAKVTYSKPVEQPIIEFNPPDDEDEEETEEEEVVRRYDATFAEDEEEVEFSQKTSFDELCTALRVFASNRGVAIEKSSIRALLSAMASGRLVFIICKNKEIAPKFTDVLCEYFGISGRVTASEEWNTQENLLWKRGASADDYVLSEISNAINSAGKTPERNCFMMIENVSMLNLEDYFSTFLDYANFPSEEHIIKFSEDVSLKMPPNICFLLMPSNDNFTEDLTPAIAHAGIIADMVVSKVEPTNIITEEEIKVLSRMDLEEIMGEAREKFFLNETVWKKIDDFTEAVNATERFSIDNKSLLQLEKYTSVLMECGGDENEALINMFTAKIVPLLKVSKAYKKEDGGKTLYGIIEKLFTDENLSAVQKALVSNVAGVTEPGAVKKSKAKAAVPETDETKADGEKTEEPQTDGAEPAAEE